MCHSYKNLHKFNKNQFFAAKLHFDSLFPRGFFLISTQQLYNYFWCINRKSNMMNKQRRWSNVQWNNMAWVVKFNSQRLTERSTRYFTTICFKVEWIEFKMQFRFQWNIYHETELMIFYINDSNNQSSYNIISRLSILISILKIWVTWIIQLMIKLRLQIRFSFAEKMSRIW